MTVRNHRMVIFSALLAGLGITATGFAEMESGPSLAKGDLLSKEARDYYIDGPWIYKVNRRSKDLMAQDFNGDGLLDLAVVSNEKSILEVFYQKKGGAGEDLFTKQTVTLDRVIRNASAVDVNGDGRFDILLAGSPKLLIMYQGKDGRFEPAKETDLEADRIVTGDIDGDKRTDVLLFREGAMQILKGEGRGISLEPSQKFFTTGSPASAPMLIDFDGDGRTDIVFHDSGRFEDLVVRLQSPEGTFPSEFRATTTTLRAVAPLAKDKGAAHIAAVQNQTRDLVELALAEVNPETVKAQAVPTSDIQTIALDPEKRSKESGREVADVDGDGRLDLVISSKDLSVLRFVRQTRGGSLVEETIPSLQGVEGVVALSAPKGEPTPLLLFSPSEKAVGFIRYDAKTKSIPFPTLLPVGGIPEAIAVTTVGKDQTLVAILKADGADKEKPPRVVGFTIDASGKIGPAKELVAAPGDGKKSPLAGIDIVGMDTMDVNRDGRQDLVVYADFKPARIYVQDEKGGFAELAATSGVLEGLLAGSQPGSLRGAQLGDAKSPSAVVALKEKFARAFTIDKDGNVVVEHQFNGKNSSSRLGAMTVGHLRGGETPEVILLDRGTKVLTVYGIAKDKKEYEILSNIDLDGADYVGIEAFDLDGDNKDDIVLTAEDRLSVIYAKPLNGGLESVASIATAEEDGGYGTVFTAQLLSDAAPETVAIEMKEALMEIFQSGKGEDKLPAFLRFYSFKMYDSETTIARRVNLDAPPEPRELVAADVNGDGKNEVITLMHDNIVIYYPTGKKK